MTSAQPITVQLQPYLQQGLSLWLEGGMLRFKAPKELMTPAVMGLLKQNKEAIVAWLQSEADSSQTATAKVVDEFPLAFTQGAIWMLYRFAPNSPAYNTTFACTLKGELNETAVRQAFHALMIRHPMLRTTFQDADTGPRQKVWDHMEMPLQMVDGSGWNESELQQWLEQEADAAFDLTQQSCLRVKIVHNSVRGNILIATVHHVGADLWALLIVAKDIKEFYQCAAKGEVLSLSPTSVHYRQHVEWQQTFLQSERGKVMRRYWQRALQGAPMIVTLPTDFPRPPVLQLKTRLIRHVVEQNTCNAIRAFCKRHSITPFVFVQSALQLMVYRYTQAQDFLMGTPTMGRSQKGMDQVVGDFANPVVLRARIQSDMWLQDLFASVKQTLLGAMEYQDYPFPAVVQDCNPPRDSSRTPLFQIMLVWHQGNADLLANDDWIGEVLPLSGPRGAPYDVMLAVSDLGDHLELNWTSQTSLYKAETVEQFGQILLSLLDTMLENPDARVADCMPALQHNSEWQPDVTQSEKLQAYSHCCLQQSLTDGRSIRRVFVEFAGRSLPAELQHWLENGFAGADDISVLTNFPRCSDGRIDTQALRNAPLLDRARMSQALQKAGLTQDQVAILHERTLVPSIEAAELAQWQQKSKHLSPLRKIDISQRPDAWVVGEPLALPSDSPRHLFTALAQTAQRFPDRGITLHDDQRIATHYSYAELTGDARRVAAALQKTGLERGSILLLQMRYDRRFFAVWWGAVLFGLKPLNVATPDHYNERNGVAQKLYNVAHNYDNLTVAADRQRLADTQAWLGQRKPVINADELLQETAVYEGSTGDDPVAFLQLTSGSTGTPKAIQITHHGILHHVAASAIHNDYSADNINLNWLPFDHVVPILTTHVKDCVMGIRQIQLTTRSVLADPLWWLQAMSQYRVTHSWAPNFAFHRVAEALVHAEPAGPLDLSAVRNLMNAGEQVLAPVVQRFHARCASFGLRADAVQPAFGMAESCTCITYNNNASEQLSVHFNPTLESGVCDINQPHLASHGFVDLGPLMPGVEIRITDEHNQLVKEGVIGRMQIRGPVVTPGYLNNPDANAEAFVGDGWFNSGDLGFIWNRRLILTGREKEMIVVNGANYYCFELEQAATIPGVLPTFVAASGVALEAGNNSDALVLFYVPNGSMDDVALERQMSARMAEAFGLAPTYLIPVHVEQFYKTTSGKIQRGQFKKQFEKQFYADQVEAYRERHRQNADLCTTLFAGGFQPLAHTVQNDAERTQLLVTPDLMQHSSVVHWQAQGANIEVFSPDYLTSPDAAHVVVLLSDLSDANTDQANTLLALTQRLSELQQQSFGSTMSSTRYTVAVFGESVADTLLLKPLVETLRQETGISHLRGVVVSNAMTGVPDWHQLRNRVQPVHWLDESALTQPVLRAVNLLPHHAHAISRNSVFAITGGLAGLAEPLCQYLIVQKRCKVILLGRTPLDQDSERAFRFRQWQRQFGAMNLDYQTLPVWDVEQLHLAISTSLSRLGAQKLDGIFHLAGHLAMAPMSAVDAEHWQLQAQPKGQGGDCVLNYLTHYAPKAMLVHYSSLNAYFGGQNAAGYSAANALQSWQACNNTSSVRVWSLHWSVWSNTGMATRFSTSELQLARNKGLLPLDKSRDLFWLDQALAQPPGNYYIGLDHQAQDLTPELDKTVQSRVQFHVHLHWPEQAARPDVQTWFVEPQPSVDHLQVDTQWWEQPLPRHQSGLADHERLREAKQAPTEHCVPPVTQTESELQSIWHSVLGRSIPDVTRSFFEYGGHSINATQLIARINQQFERKLSVAHLFQYPTIRQLADVLTDANESSAGLSLGLQDFIQRADGFRIDCVNPQITAGRNIVFLPTASGLCSAYLQIMSQLTGARLYVLSMPLQYRSSDSIERMAVEFIGLMSQSDLLGENTTLVGWSMGGVLGYELLQQLQKQQQTLPALVMLDSGFADGLHPITFDPAFQLLMFAVELGLGAEHFATFNQLRDTAAKLSWLQQYLLTIGIEVTQAKLLEWSDAYQARLQQLERYSSQHQDLVSPVTLFKADWHSHGRSDLGWGESNKNINWQSVAADHQGIVKHSDVASWLRQHCV